MYPDVGPIRSVSLPASRPLIGRTLPESLETLLGSVTFYNGHIGSFWFFLWRIFVPFLGFLGYLESLSVNLEGVLLLLFFL